MSSQSRSARIRASRCSTSSTSSSPAQSATGADEKPHTSAQIEDIQDISRLRSFSHASRPACAKTFRLGFRPTASRLDVALTRKVKRKRMRGCVTWRTTGADLGKGIYASKASARVKECAITGACTYARAILCVRPYMYPPRLFPPEISPTRPSPSTHASATAGETPPPHSRRA